MNWTTVLQLVSASLIPLAVVGITHWASKRRDYENERRKLRIQYLIEAYRRLEDGSNRAPSEEFWRNLESAIADVQLFGTAHQASLARQFALTMADAKSASLDALIADLRNSLRTELSLEPLSEGPIYLRQHKRPRDEQHTEL